MKIISKFKDYYDYLQGVYGIDDLLVLDRRSNSILIKPFVMGDELISYSFAICNHIYIVRTYKGKIYQTLDETNDLNKILFKDNEEQVNRSDKWWWGVKRTEVIRISQEDWNKRNTNTDINIRLRQPILVSRNERPKDEDWGTSIILSDFKLIKALPAHDIFTQISSFLAWLKDNPEIPNKQSNEEKLLSHGFDKKKSFRHRK